MKTKLLPILMACACAASARAQFNPVALTPGSYDFGIVVPNTTPQPLPSCINVTAGAGVSLGDNTYFEQGYYSRVGTPGGNFGIPIHGTTFTSINNGNMQFVMPPNYNGVNNELMVDSTFPSGALVFNTATTATNLAILCCGGGGPLTVNYTVTHTDNSTETGTLSLPDWFAGGSSVAWGSNARVDENGNYQVVNNSSVNNGAPYLYGLTITVSNAPAITQIAFSSPSQNHGNFYAVSANASGGQWTPVTLNVSSSFNVMGTVPAAFPVTATMDQGTNTANTGNGMNTWFEQGYYTINGGDGLPPSGSTFTSVSQPTHTYQMGNYSANNATLIDATHLSANLTPASPTNYSAFALLTAGGNVGGGQNTNLCILQHQDGVNETNLFFGYDWYNSSIPPAFISNGRVDMYNRTLNTLGGGNPKLFESYFVLNDTASPVTNILLQFVTSTDPSATTFIMAVSATSGAVPAVVATGPTPSTQTIYPSQSANFQVTLSGTAPVGGYWTVENNGTYVPLTDGTTSYGSIISGSQTTSLSISNAYVADGTNYEFVATNAANLSGSASLPGVLIVNAQTISITPTNTAINTSNTLTLTANLSPGPPVRLQWYSIDTSMNSNSIPGATNITYTIANAPLSLNGYTYGVIGSNIYGTNSASVVLSVSDSAAYVAVDLRPSIGEAYVGASVTYGVTIGGNSPISYQWMTNGVIVPGATGSTLTFPATCGTETIQVAFSNALSGGIMTTSSLVTLAGISYPAPITFNSNGTGWTTNSDGSGNVPTIVNNVLQLTDGGGGEGSSAFYDTAQYVGGTWTASFIYNSHGGAADGTCFILQTINTNALGAPGGDLGYGPGITNSLAFQINLYPLNGETIGIAGAVNGNTHNYFPCLPVQVNGTNPISVTLTWSNGVLAASLEDTVTLATYSTNYTFGPLVNILGANVAYIGFSGGDGGATSTQTVSNLSFVSHLAPISLSVSPVTANSFTISWPAADPSYMLVMSPSLKSPSWIAAPAPVVVNGTNKVTVAVPGSGQQFYRLIRMVCQ